MYYAGGLDSSHLTVACLVLTPIICLLPVITRAMDPTTAMGCAANVIQFVDFGRKLVSGSLEIYGSADGISAEHISIGDISKSLSELIVPLRARRDTRLGNERNVSNRNRLKEKVSVAEKKLNGICEDCDTVAQQLQQELEKLRLRGGHRKCGSFKQALSATCGIRVRLMHWRKN